MEWKTKPLADLVEKLSEMVEAQYRELQRALIGRGEYKLLPEFKQFSVDADRWSQWDAGKRGNHFTRFMKTIKKVNSSTLRSSDGHWSEKAPTVSGGKKPGQTKRKRPTRTTTPMRTRSKNVKK